MDKNSVTKPQSGEVNMTKTTIEALRELAAKWRAEADEIAANQWACNANSIRARADELEAALAALSQGEAVAWQTRYPGEHWIECSRDWYEAVKKDRPSDARALYDRPTHDGGGVTDEMVERVMRSSYRGAPITDALAGAGDEETEIIRAILTAAQQQGEAPKPTAFGQE